MSTTPTSAAPVAAEVPEPQAALSRPAILEMAQRAGYSVKDWCLPIEMVSLTQMAYAAGARAALAAQPAAEPHFIYTGQPGLELEQIFDGINHGTAFYASAPAAGQAAPAQAQALTEDDIEEIAAQVGIGMVKGNAAANELLRRFAERVRAHGIPAPTGAAPTGADPAQEAQR